MSVFVPSSPARRAVPSFPFSRLRRAGSRSGAALGLAAAAIAPCTAAARAADPWADAVVSYAPGTNAVPGYTAPASALGMPARTTGAGVDPSVVSPFVGAFLPQEIVSIGAGGALVLEFDEPVADDPANPFGADLLVFGNVFFVDAAPPAGTVAGLFDEGGLVEVSADGVDWIAVTSPADGLVPTRGFVDAGPYDDAPGAIPTDFTRPVDPALFASAAVLGATWPDLLERYGTSGGGTPVDLAATGLAEIRFVRFSVAAGGAAIEIDAVADVAPAGPPEDLDGDGTVGFGDLVALLTAWGACAGCPADLDGDGSVGFADLVTLLTAWSS